MQNYTVKSSFLAIFACAALTAAPALAQDSDSYTKPAKAEPLTAQEQFIAVDLDQTGNLDQDEYVSYVVMRADAGDAAHKAVVLSGEYDTDFAAKDADANGTLSESELGLAASEAEDETDSGLKPESKLKPKKSKD